MRTPILVSITAAVLVGCASKKPAPPVEPGAEAVRVSTSHPGAGFFELGPVSGLDGRGCGEDGKRGGRDGALASLMKNAFAMGGTYVQVMTLNEPRQMGECFVNAYRINGTAYREARAASAQASGTDVVQQLRGLQRLREEGVITQPEFDKLKAKLIGAP
jgi:hypothetical protein